MATDASDNLDPSDEGTSSWLTGDLFELGGATITRKDALIAVLGGILAKLFK